MQPTIVTRNVVRSSTSGRPIAIVQTSVYNSPGGTEVLELTIPPREEREPNPVFVELLKDAIKDMWDGDGAKQLQSRTQCRYEFICDALENLQDSYPADAITSLQDCITQSLGASSYAGWMMRRVARDAWISFSETPDAQMRIQAARLRWMKQLIEEYGGVV